MNALQKYLEDFFVPKQENNYQSGSLHLGMLSTYLLIAIFFVFVSKTTPLFSNVLGIATDININKLLEGTNEERAKANLSPLKLNTQLTVAAQKKAAHMFQNDYWAHFAPDGTSPWDFIKQSGYSYEYAGENLAKNFLFSQNVVDAWMNSPSHRENLLRKEYTDVGFAVVNGMLGGENTTLVVQMFGSPIQGVAESPSSSSPEKTVVSKETSAKVLGDYQKSVAPVNGKKFAYNINILFVFFIFAALAIDLVFASKLNILHLHGRKNLAHLIFIGFIGVSILFILKQGAII